MLGMGAREAGEGRAAGAAGQPSRAGMAGEAGASLGTDSHGISRPVAHIAQGRSSHWGSATVGMTGGAVCSEGGRSDGQMAIEFVVGLTRQERNWVGGWVRAMAEGGVVAAGLGTGSCWREGLPGGIVGRARIVALGADSGIGWIGGRVGIDRAAGDTPRLGRVGGLHAMTGCAGAGGGSAGEVLAVAELTGNETPPVSLNGQLGAHAMDGSARPARRGLVVTASGKAGWNPASHFDDRELMTLGAGIHSRQGLPTMGTDPPGGVVVPIILGNGTRTLAAATPQHEQGHDDRAQHAHDPDPIPNAVHGDTRSCWRFWLGPIEIRLKGPGYRFIVRDLHPRSSGVDGQVKKLDYGVAE